jgi:hypothetical protein
MRRDISNSADILDSRDVIKRIAELESDRDSFEPEDGETWPEAFPEEAAELEALEALAKEGEGSADWNHGETLSRDSYFEDYARELADDIGAIKSDAGWPNSFIDWKAAAEALQVDYFNVDFDGVTYWIRG